MSDETAFGDDIGPQKRASSDRIGFFEHYRGSIAYIEVQKPDGDLSIGSAFHVGGGVFVTARHVVEGNRVTDISTTEEALVGVPVVGAGGAETREHVSPNKLTLLSGPHFHPNPKVDVAVFATTGLSQSAPFVPLGGHFDDWIGASDFVLSEVLVLGYPPIPLDREARLVALRAQVIAQFDPYDRPHPHFVLSAMPRGGLSGGLVWSEWGFALGMVTHSTSRNNDPVELGFLTVLTVEPIYECLESHGLLPPEQNLPET